MPMTGDAFGGNTGLMLLLNPETGEQKWVTPAEYESEQRWIADEDAFLTERAGFGLTWRNPTSQEEADKWDYAQRTHQEELQRRQRDMKRRAAFKPATLFETPDGDMPVLNENVPAFLKTEREKGYEPKQVKGYRSKGFIGADGQKYDSPRFFAGTDDDPALKKILMFQHENKLNGYLTPNMMRFMGYDTQESFEKEEAANARRNERMVENEKRMNFRGMNMPMETSEVFGNAVGFGGQSLSKTNKGKGTASQINNFQAAHLNPVASTIDEWGEAVEMRLGSDEGLEELKRREAEGEDLLTGLEKFRLGLWGDAMEGVGAEGVHAYMRERQANRRGAEFTEAARGTTAWANVLRATTDSARMGIEHALYNSLLPGFKEGATVGQKWAGGLMGTGIAMGLHGDAKRQKLMADQFQYDPTTGSIKVSQKGAGAIEAALKGYSSAALNYVGEMFSNELLWKPAAKFGKWTYSKLPPSKFKKFTDSLAERYAGSKFVKFLDQVSANPTMEMARRLNKRTGINLSVEGMISETIGEELPANMLTAGFGLEAPGAGGWEEAFDAGIETFKNAPTLALSVLLMGAGQGVAVRSSQGLYNYATDRATMEKALEALGHKREELKGKKKMELNDLFFAEMAKRGDNLWEEEKIDQMSESELDELLKAYNVLPDGDNGQNIPIDQKRSTFKNFLRENGANVFANAAIAKINRATVRSILNGWNYGNVTDRLNTDLFVKHRDIDPESRDKMRKIMTLRSMANTGTYRGNLAGHMLDAFANSLEGELSAKDQATLKQFENQYAKSSVAFPGTEESKGITYEASTFKHPVAQSDWNNNPDGGYVDFGTGIAIRPHQDENGNAAGYRVDVNGAKMTVGQAGSEVDRQLSLLGINPQIGLPYGVQTTTFKTLPEARQFADNLSAWQNTEKKRLLEKAQVAQLIYDRTRPDAPGGLVLLRRPEDAPDAIRDEMVDGLRASPNRSGVSLFTRFGAAQGFTSVRDGKVYLFLDNISSPYTMLNTVQHEGLHQGLIDTFRGDSKKRIAFLNELMKDPELPTFIKDELAKADNNVRVFEDILAAVAESVNNGPGLFNAVSKAMRNASARIDGIPMEEGDIHSLIFDAYKAQRIDAEQMPLNNKPTSGSYDQMKLEHGAETELQIVEPTTTEEVETLPKGTPEDAVKAVEDFAKAHPDGDAPTVENTQSSQKSTVQPTAPVAEAPKAEVKSEPKHGDDRRGHMAKANDFFDNDETAVLELGGNYIPEHHFKWEHLADLNGMDDITTPESQKRIYDKVDAAEALGAKIANEFRANGFQETSQSEQWRDEFQTFAEIVNDLPDSDQKKWALKKLANSWKAMESEIEKLSALRDNRKPDMEKVGTQTTRPNPPQPTSPLPNPKTEKKLEPKVGTKPEPKATPAPKQEVPKVNKDGTKVRDPIDKAASIIASNFYQGHSGMPSVKLGDGKYALDLSHKYGAAGSVIEVYCYNKKTEELARKVISDSAKDGKNPFYSDKKGVHDYGTTFHIWSRKSSVKALLETFGFDESQEQRFGVPVEAKTTTPKPAPKAEPKAEAIKEAPKPAPKSEPKPAPKAEAPKVAPAPVAPAPKTDSVTEKASAIRASLIDTFTKAGVFDASALSEGNNADTDYEPGLFREGDVGERISQKEMDRRAGDAVYDLAMLHVETGGRTFKGFAKFAFDTLNVVAKLWELSKKYLRPQWELTADRHPELNLDEVTRAEAAAILSEVESGTIKENNKEVDNDRLGDSLEDAPRGDGVGSGPEGSRTVRDSVSDGDDGLRTSGGDGHSRGGVREGDRGGRVGVQSSRGGSQPHQDVVVDQSASDSQVAGGVSGEGTGDAGGRSGGDGRRTETPLPEVGSSSGVLPASPAEGGTSSADGRGKGSETKLPEKTQSRKDSLLKGVAVDYVIPKNGGKIGKLGGAKARYAANIEALKILKTIQEEGRYATPEEQEKLALYSGWGGLAAVFNEGNKGWDTERNELRNLLSKEDFELARRSVQYAHFTPISVVQTMYKALEKMGVKGEGVTFFEAGTGVGNFIGSRPEAMRGAPYMGVEVDPVTSRIVKALYPNANISQAGFQNFTLPENSVDVVVGNPPYSDLKLYDKHFPESKGMSIHNHFIAKQIRALRPGGVGTFVVSRYFMDSQDARTREYILSQADLISAVRLPNGVFGEIAGTDVVTDILVFRKRLPGEPKPLRTDPNGLWVDTRLYSNPKRETDPKKAKREVVLSVPMNRYFLENPRQILGELEVVIDSRYNSPTLSVMTDKLGEKGENLDRFATTTVANALTRNIPEGSFAPIKSVSPQMRDQQNQASSLQSGATTVDGANHPALMEGGHFIGDDGDLYLNLKDEWGNARHVKVTPFDEKAEKAAHLARETRLKDDNPKYKVRDFKRFRDTPNATAKLLPKEVPVVKALVHLRNVRYDLIALERSAESTQEQLDSKRKELNEAYDAVKVVLNKLTKPQGEFSLNVKIVRDLLGSDPALGCIIGLEEYKQEKKKNPDGTEVTNSRYRFVDVKKAAIFHHRVYHPEAEMKSHFDNATDAYIASINAFGKLDMEWMSEVLGVGEIELENILSENGLAFFDPKTNIWTPREVYLSGDVKTKLAQAERALEAGDKRMEKNVERLKEVQPADIPIENITITFGSPLMDVKDVNNFARERLGFTNSDGINATYSSLSGQWGVSVPDNTVSDKTRAEFPFPGSSFGKILSAALNNKSVQVFDKVGDQRILNQARTDTCNKTIGAIRNLFESWWKESPKRAKSYADEYNEKFNRYVQAKYDGSALTLEGLDKSYTPYKHQRDAVMRTIQTGNVLYNHVVGSGKTLTAIMSIMEMRRMGLVKKPCIVVPNSLTQQWRSDFLKAYPGANVLAPSSDEFTAGERKRLMARIQNGDWDVVIIPHSQLSLLDLQPEVKRQFIEAEINNLRASIVNEKATVGNDAPGMSRVEKRLEKLEVKLLKSLGAIEKDDTGIYFDTLGIDGLFVDEAHEFKNVPYVSTHQVAGMGNATGSSKALDLLTKVQWMRKAMPNAPIGFLTGTPVSNSLCELYLNMRYMAPDLLTRMGLQSMDTFLEQFVNISSEFEIQPSGAYKEKKRVRNMKNIGTFMQGVFSYMDVVDADDLKQSMRAVGKEPDIPELEGGAPINVVAKRSPEQKEYFGVPITRVQDRKTGDCITEYPRGTILKRSEDLQERGVVDKKVDNMLKVVGDATKASLDMRLVDSNIPDFEGSKINLCVNNILENYKNYTDNKGTQIVFCDRGIPSSGKAELRKELKELKKKLEKEEITLLKMQRDGKTEEEIAETVDKEGESVIDRIDRLTVEITGIESELASTFSVYEDIKKKLVAQGIPAEEIAFIHDYPKDEQKRQLFVKMNEGKVRILIGSTGKMGTGVNVQERIVALHHLDVPWRPADLIQRNGRAIRQGNKLKQTIPGFTMRVYQYATERTGDAFRWQTLEAKAKALSDIYKVTPDVNVIEDISEDASDAGDMKAAATGSKINPRAAVVRKRAKVLEDARIAQIHKRSGLEETVGDASANIDSAKATVVRFEEAKKLITPLERPDGNMYYGIVLNHGNNGLQEFAPEKAFTKRIDREGENYESIGFTLLSNKNTTLSYRGLHWRVEEVERSLGAGRVLGYATRENALNKKRSLFNETIYLDTVSPSSPDSHLITAINKTLNSVDERLERYNNTIIEEQELLENSEKALAEMPETFEPTEEQKQLQVEANDLEYVLRRNCQTGSEADYALKIKYRNEGKTMPNYDWADPYDYGESDAPTQLDPPIDLANAGLFREGVVEEDSGVDAGLFREDPDYKPKRTYHDVTGKYMYKLMRLVDGHLEFPMAGTGVPVPTKVWLIAEDLSEVNPKTGKRKVNLKFGSSKVKKDGTVSRGSGTASPYPGFHMGPHPYMAHLGIGGTRRQAHFQNADYVWVKVDVPYDMTESYANEIKGKNPDSVMRGRIPHGGFYWRKTNQNMEGMWAVAGAMKIVEPVSDNEVDEILDEALPNRVRMGRQGGGRFNAKTMKIEGQDLLNWNFEEEEAKFNANLEAGLFREDPSLLDEERALRRAAMPKGQLAKAQEAVHNALVRNEGETPKAWAKRKVKAVGSFVSSLMVDSRRPVVDAMKEITGREKFHESEDIPLAMQLSYGRVFAGHHNIDTNYVKPVLKKLADNGLNLEDLDIYLTAKFAPERNKMIKERTETATKPGNLEGSGMSDEKAAALLNAMREEMTPVQFNALESAAELVYKMNRENLDRLVEYGIMAEEQAEEWKRLSPHYVPLRDDLSDLGVEFPDQVSMVGQNYVHAVGRFSEAVTSQFAWSILQAKQGIMWAEQNYINNVALNFCHNNKSDEDYVISPMPVMSKKVYKGKRGFRPDDAIALRTSVPSEAAALKTLAEAGFTLVPDKKNEGVYWVDTREMEMIPRVRNTVDKLRTAQRHNVIAKVGGKKVYILFNPQKNTRGNRMGRAITRADMWDPKHPLWTVVTQLTRIKSLMTTTLSPTFAINNMRRDLVQTTGIMLAEGRGEALKDVYRNYLPALKAVRDWKKTDKFDDTEVGRYFKEAVENGVLTGTWANSTHTDTMINSVLDPLFDMQNRQKFGKEIGATIGVSYRGLKDFLNTFSEIPEVGMRLAVYSALRKNGMSKNEATVYAREITIDFNKKGQLTPVMNVLYMFSNASIQSVARWNKAIRNPDGTISKRAYLGALSYMLIGFFNKMLIATAASALFGGGDDDEKDDERWKNIPDYAYQRGVPIMLGDYYVDMPVQGIPSAFLYLGSRLYDVLVDPDTSVAEAFVDTAKGPLLENVNFVNGTGSVWQFLTPTFLDPIVQIIENKSWTGAPLHASRYPNDTTPASYSGRKTTSEWAKAVAKGLNAISGGDDIKPGAMDFYPETIALIGQFFVSQVGVDAAGIGQLLTGDLKVKNVPILRGLLKEVPDETNRYYAAATDFAEKLSYWKDYNSEGRDSDVAKLERNNSFLLEANRLQNIQNRIRKLVTEKNRLAARGIEAPDVDKSISYYRKLFLDVYSGKTEK